MIGVAVETQEGIVQSRNPLYILHWIRTADQEWCSGNVSKLKSSCSSPCSSKVVSSRCWIASRATDCASRVSCMHSFAIGGTHMHDHGRLLPLILCIHTVDITKAHMADWSASEYLQSPGTAARAACSMDSLMCRVRRVASFCASRDRQRTDRHR